MSLRSLLVTLLAFSLFSQGIFAADESNPLAESKPLELIKDGFTKADTPQWLADGDGGYLVFTDLEKTALFKLIGEKSIEQLKPDITRGTIAPDGKFVGIIEGKLSSWKPGEDARQLVEISGSGLEPSLNDIVVSPRGFAYFSTLKDPEKGRFSIIDLGTKKVTVAWDGEQEAGLWNPNGVAISPDGKFLYVGISSYKNQKTSGVYRFAIQADGSLDVAAGKEKPFIDVKRPDGIAVDTAGNIYFTAGAVVNVYSPSAKKLGSLKIPKGSGTNLCFGGKDMKTLYVTTFNALYRTDVSIPGTLP